MTRSEVQDQMIRSAQHLTDNWDRKLWRQEIDRLDKANAKLSSPIDLEPLYAVEVQKTLEDST